MSDCMVIPYLLNLKTVSIRRFLLSFFLSSSSSLSKSPILPHSTIVFPLLCPPVSTPFLHFL
eukprot:UN18878